MTTNPAELKEQIFCLAREYSRMIHTTNLPGYGETAIRRPFVQAKDSVPYAGRICTDDEVSAEVASTLDFWLTPGKEGDAFEAELAKFLGVRRSILCNSGSSANLLAATAPTSFKLVEATADATQKQFQIGRVEQLETWRRQATLIMPMLKTLLASPRR